MGRGGHSADGPGTQPARLADDPRFADFVQGDFDATDFASRALGGVSSVQVRRCCFSERCILHACIAWLMRKHGCRQSSRSCTRE